MANDYLAWNKESAFSTDPGIAAAEWAEMLSETLRPANQTDIVQGAYYETATDEGLGTYGWTGGVQMKLAADNGIGHILTQLFGDEDAGFPTGPVEPAESDRLHQWSSPAGVGYGTSVAALLSRSNGIEQWNYLGGVVNRLNIEAVLNQDLRWNPELAGDQDEIDATAETPPDPLHDADFFRHHDSDWKIAVAPGAAVSDLDVEAWSLNIESASEVVPNISTRFGRRVYRAGYNMTGRVDRDFVDALYYRRAAYGDDTSDTPQDTIQAHNVEIEITGAAIPGSAAQVYKLIIQMPRVKFFDIEANVSGRDRITSGVPFTVLRDKTLAYAMRIQLQNQFDPAY